MGVDFISPVIIRNAWLCVFSSGLRIASEAPFPWLNQPTDEASKITDYIYKTTYQMKESVYDKAFYPISNLERSAKAFTVPFYRRRNTNQLQECKDPFKILPKQYEFIYYH
nr:hypothetical transcript [Hymenolepis microstoma]